MMSKSRFLSTELPHQKKKMKKKKKMTTKKKPHDFEDDGGGPTPRQKFCRVLDVDD